MSATTVPPTTSTDPTASYRNRQPARSIPTTRLVRVELRKMFNTRSGFWLLASIGVLSPLSAASLIVLGPDSDISYEGERVPDVGDLADHRHPRRHR